MRSATVDFAAQDVAPGQVVQLYLAMSRDTGSPSDVLAAKASGLQAELEEWLARFVVHWSAGGVARGPAATIRFQTRIAR